MKKQELILCTLWFLNGAAVCSVLDVISDFFCFHPIFIVLWFRKLSIIPGRKWITRVGAFLLRKSMPVEYILYKLIMFVLLLLLKNLSGSYLHRGQVHTDA